MKFTSLLIVSTLLATGLSAMHPDEVRSIVSDAFVSEPMSGSGGEYQTRGPGENIARSQLTNHTQDYLPVYFKKHNMDPKHIPDHLKKKAREACAHVASSVAEKLVTDKRDSVALSHVHQSLDRVLERIIPPGTRYVFIDQLDPSVSSEVTAILATIGVSKKHMSKTMEREIKRSTKVMTDRLRATINKTRLMFCTHAELMSVVNTSIKPLMKQLEYSLKMQVLKAELAALHKPKAALKDLEADDRAELYRLIAKLEAMP